MASFSLGLCVGFLLVGFAALRALELLPHPAPPTREPVDQPANVRAPAAWRGQVSVGDASVSVRLVPLHDEPALEEFRARALERRYALPPGEPWRLYLSLAGPPGGTLELESARVGEELVPFAALLPAAEGPDPVRALLAAQPGPLEVERAQPMVLWGRLQSAAPELTIVGRVSAGSSASGSAALERDEDGSPPRWYAGEALAAREGSPLEAEVARLERELQRERTRRAEREQAFLEFSRLVAQLPAARELGLAPAETPPAPPSPEELEREAAAAARRARGEELGRSLAVLMRLEGLRGLDLLESGALLEDPPVGIGPVVFRCLDEHGGLAGSLRAERLRLEGSLAAHTLTLVLEGGFESRGGERVPFANGLRRIALQDVDPEPWLEECPELFADRSLAGPADDGLWRLSEVRRELNRLLALEPSRGWYRVHSLGGVRGKTLRDVQLDELDPAGRVTRRFCADALVLALEDGSVALELEGGAIVSGSDKQPFRDGRYRIVLPGVALAPWRAAILPGLAPPPKLEGAPEPAGG